jgi:hypothetical protein
MLSIFEIAALTVTASLFGLAVFLLAFEARRRDD